MAVEDTDKPKALVRLETLIGCADQRLARARQRLDRAQQEHDEAVMGLTQAKADRRQWLEDNPPPQTEMEI